MKLAPDLAEKIIKEARSVIDEQFIIVDAEYTIISSSDPSRIGKFHEGAKIAIEEKRTLFINEGLSRNLQGVKMGINLPIYHKYEIIGVFGITGDPVKVQPFAELLRRMTELLIREAHQAALLEWKTRGIETYVYQWIHSIELDQEFIERGEILGISMVKNYQMIMLEFDQLEIDVTVHNRIIEWFQQKLLKGKHDVIIRWGHNQLIWLCSSHETKELSNQSCPENQRYDRLELENNIKKCEEYFCELGFARVHVGASTINESKNLQKSYQEAHKALMVSKKNQCATYYEDLLLDIILEEITPSTRKEYVTHILNRIKGYPELLNTIKVYLENDSGMKKTAAAMHIHPNTLIYRLKQVKELTAIDVKTTEGVVLFYFLLTLSNLSDIERSNCDLTQKINI